MDAFSVSLANGMNEPFMGRLRMSLIAGVYAFFQFFMPLAGWFFVRTAASAFSLFEKAVPWIALVLLCYIGGSMALEGIRKKGDVETAAEALDLRLLIMQGIATSIDALSVGFAISHYGTAAAFISALIIAAVTFIICFSGLAAGKRAGVLLAGKAKIFGGLILIGIGIEIFISSFQP